MVLHVTGSKKFIKYLKLHLPFRQQSYTVPSSLAGNNFMVVTSQYTCTGSPHLLTAIGVSHSSTKQCCHKGKLYMTVLELDQLSLWSLSKSPPFVKCNIR